MNWDPQLLFSQATRISGIAKEIEEARSAFSKNQISDALDEGKNMWKELRHLGLIPKHKEALYGFINVKLFLLTVSSLNLNWSRSNSFLELNDTSIHWVLSARNLSS